MSIFRRFLLVIALFLSAVSMTGCGGGSSGGTDSSGGNAIIPSTTKVLDSNTTQNLTSVSGDSSTLTFSASTGQLQSLSPGDVIAIGVSASTPNGLLRKVVSISTAGTQVIVQTAPATVTDAIQSGTVQVSKTLTQSDTKKTTALKEGVSFKQNNTARILSKTDSTVGNKGGGLEWSIDLVNVVLYDADGNTNTTSDQIIANGNVSFNLGFDFNMQVDHFKLKKLTFTNTATENTKITVGTNVSYSLKKEVAIGKIEFAPITVWAGMVPVVITPTATINVGLDGSVSVGITAGTTQVATLTTGLSYDNGNWSPISNFSNQFTFNSPSLSAGANMKAYGGPQLNLMLYGVAGPYANIYGYLKLTADINSNPWWTLYGGLESNVGVKVEVLDYTITNYSTTVIDYNVVLATAGYTISDLQGTWNIFSLASGSDWNGWCHDKLNVDSNGNVTSDVKLCSDGSTTPSESGTFSINSNGIIGMSSRPSFHGVMSKSKDIIVGTTTAGNHYYLVVAQKSDPAATYSTSDFSGAWNFHDIISGSWYGWCYGPMNIDLAGSGTSTRTCSDGGSRNGTFTVDASGIVRDPSDPSFYGFMNKNKDLIVATGTAGTQYALIMMQKSDASIIYNSADLSGGWNVHDISSGPNWKGWYYGRKNIDPSGNLTFSNILRSDGSTNLPASTALSISQNGIISSGTIPSLHGFLNSGKDLGIAIQTDSGGNANLSVFQK